jgi:hypothetical protein
VTFVSSIQIQSLALYTWARQFLSRLKFFLEQHSHKVLQVFTEVFQYFWWCAELTVLFHYNLSFFHCLSRSLFWYGIPQFHQLVISVFQSFSGISYWRSSFLLPSSHFVLPLSYCCFSCFMLPVININTLCVPYLINIRWKPTGENKIFSPPLWTIIITPRKLVTTPVTVAAEWSKAWTVLARLDSGIVGSNPSYSRQGCLCVCVRLFYVCVVLCR